MQQRFHDLFLLARFRDPPGDVLTRFNVFSSESSSFRKWCVIISASHNSNQNKVQMYRGASILGEAQMFQMAWIRWYSHSAKNKWCDLQKGKKNL